MLRSSRLLLSASLGLALTAGTLLNPLDGVTTVAAAGSSVTTLNSTYTVVNGDYLSGIAMKLNVSLKSLLKVNNLELTSLILPGMQLKVPVTASTAGSLKAASTPTSTTVAAPATSTYTVVWGDFLTGIAAKLGVSTRSLLTANKLQLNSLIYPGMQLVVPKGGTLPKSPTTAPAGATTTSTAPAAPQDARYTVVNNDSLSGIAAKLGVSLKSLLSTNQLTVSSFIYPGMQLVVPKGGTLPSSQSSSSTTKSPKISTVLAFARAQMGKPYKFNTAGPDTFDCSGLTLAAYAQIGVSLPHYSGAQLSFGTVVDWTTQPIQAGDLVFLESAPGSGVVSHVGIATSATTWIHAPRSGDVVREGNIPPTRIIGVRRLVNG